MTFMMRPSVAGPTGTVIGCRCRHRLAAGQALGGVHGDGAHGVLAQVLGDFEHQAEGLAGPLVGVGGLQRVEDRGQVAFELDVDDGADDLDQAAGGDRLGREPWRRRRRPWRACGRRAS
jgi:hypothetical protein